MDINTISVKTPQFYKCQYGRVELLNDENYPDWSNTLIFFLTADKTWSIVVGTEEAPQALPANASAARHAEYRKELLEFQARSARACSMIISSVTPSYKCFLFGKTNPKDMWDILKNRLDSLTSNSGPFIRRDQFLNERHTGKGPISTFFARLQQYPQLWLAIPDPTRTREGIREKIKQIAGPIQTIVGATRTLTQIAQAIKGTGPLRQPMILIMIMIAVAKDQSIQTIVIPTIPLMRLYAIIA